MRLYQFTSNGGNMMCQLFAYISTQNMLGEKVFISQKKEKIFFRFRFLLLVRLSLCAFGKIFVIWRSSEVIFFCVVYMEFRVFTCAIRHKMIRHLCTYIYLCYDCV